MRPFRLGGAEKRAAGRHVPKQLMHLDGRAHAAALRHHLAHAAAIDRDRGPGRIGRAGSDHEPRDFADARQRLSPEAERADPLEVFRHPQLARGMLDDRERQLVGRDAAAVIGHPHECHAPLLERHVDAGRARIERVFEQFLHDARRPLHDLTGGDAVDDRGRQFLDARHQGS